MRKMFVILSLLALGFAVCAEDAFALGRRGRGGCAGGPYYGGGQGAYYGQGGFYNGPGNFYANLGPSIGTQQSFYYDPGLQQTARVAIMVPNQNTQIWFDGNNTTQRGLERVFVTPALTQESTYTIKASWQENGKTIERERRIQVRPGQATMIDFRTNTSAPLPSSEPLPRPKALPQGPNQPESQTSVQVPNQPAQAVEQAKRTPLKIDGDWTPIYVEKNGKKIDNKDFTDVTIKNNVVTCRHGGKMRTINLDFGPHHMFRCTMQDGDSVLAQPTETRGSHTHHGD